MRYLFDTCTFLWMIADSQRLGDTARRVIADPTTSLYLSAASTWEMAIKIKSGKLEIEGSLSALVSEQVEHSSLVRLPVDQTHTFGTALLPLHHRDPFDRLLIAQAKAEQLCVLTPDDIFRSYDVSVAW